MRDESCRICGQPYAHLLGCPIRADHRSEPTWRCPDTFPTEWLPSDEGPNTADQPGGSF